MRQQRWFSFASGLPTRRATTIRVTPFIFFLLVNTDHVRRETGTTHVHTTIVIGFVYKRFVFRFFFFLGVLFTLVAYFPVLHENEGVISEPAFTTPSPRTKLGAVSKKKARGFMAK